MGNNGERLRVALVVGELEQGGAEKQAYYLVKALLSQHVTVQLYCLNRGGYYEQALCQLGLTPIWIGRFRHPLVRLAVLIRHVITFKPHIIQSTHFYVNLYSAVAAWCCRSISIGTARSDISRELQGNGFWARWLLSLPSVIVVNSTLARQNALKAGLAGHKVFILSNVVDLAGFDREFEHQPASPDAPDNLIALAVARLIPVKRLDLFLRALSLAREKEPGLTGMIAGDGPELENLQQIAADLRLSGHAVTFLGHRNDVPQLLRRAAFLVLTSDREGFPNVLIEAMAAGLPVITTPAGESDAIVQDQVTGYVVPFDDVEALADRMISLARSSDLRKRLGKNGRQRVDQQYNFDTFAGRLVFLYRQISALLNRSIPLPDVTQNDAG
jgi:glycosyltransferase involved in cell wall biosynthesis